MAWLNPGSTHYDSWGGKRKATALCVRMASSAPTISQRTCATACACVYVRAYAGMQLCSSRCAL
eukprot:6449623-Alexandrium_andersonii.AAC.1